MCVKTKLIYTLRYLARGRSPGRGSLTVCRRPTRRRGSATTGVGGGFGFKVDVTVLGLVASALDILLVRLASVFLAKNDTQITCVFCAAYPDNTVAAHYTAPKAYDAQGCPSFRGCP